MLRIKPNLCLVDADCFGNDGTLCDYRHNMSFEELIEAIINQRYAKIAIDPSNYSIMDIDIIRRLCERCITLLIEVHNPLPFGFFQNEEVVPVTELFNGVSDEDGFDFDAPFQNTITDNDLHIYLHIGQ